MKQNFKLWKISLLLLMGLFVFLYILANTVADIYYITNPVIGVYMDYDKETGQIYIDKIVPGGPADKAGLKARDKILALDDVPIAKEKGLSQLLKAVEVGETVQLTVIRNGQELKFSVFAEKLIKVYTKLVCLSLLPGVIFCYALFIIGTFVFLQKINDRTAHVFYLLVLFWALAMWHSFPFSFNSLQNVLPKWFDWVRLPFWPLAVSLLLHFTLIFPVEKKVFQKHPKIVLSFVYLPLFLIIPHIYAAIHQLNWGEPLLRYGWGILFSVNFCLAMTTLGKSCGYKQNPYSCKQAQIMLWGTTFSLSLPVGFYFLPQLFFGKLLPYSEFILLLVVLWPVTLAYAIIKHRFMDIDVIIKRGVAYGLMSGFVIAAYFLLVVGMGQLVLFLTGSRSQIVTIVATLLIAALFNPVKNRVRKFVDRRFYPSRFTYRQAVRTFSHQLVNVVDLERLLDLLIRFLFESIQIRPVVILWYNKAEAKFIVRKAKGVELNSAPYFSNEDVVIRRLQQRQRLVDLSPLKEQLDYISEDENKRWELLNTEIVLPLLSKGKLVGLLSLGMKGKNEPFYKEDLELLETLSDQINISLENALLTEELREQDRLKKELEVARRIQLSSLPQSDPQVAGLDISGVSIPALEVGGDYYDYIEFTDGRFGVVVGDVSGKGTSAALYMSQLKGILKTASKFYKSLRDIVAEVNSITYTSIELQSYITLTCGAFDLKSHKLKLVRAGHLPLIYYSAKENTCHQLVPKGIGVGLENGKIFNEELEEVEVKFGAGDVFLFYTDGIVEARNSQGDEFDINLLVKLLQENGWDSAYSLREKIIGQVQNFAANASQTDDMTLVVVKVRL